MLLVLVDLCNHTVDQTLCGVGVMFVFVLRLYASVMFLFDFVCFCIYMFCVYSMRIYVFALCFLYLFCMSMMETSFCETQSERAEALAH